MRRVGLADAPSSCGTNSFFLAFLAAATGWAEAALGMATGRVPVPVYMPVPAYPPSILEGRRLTILNGYLIPAGARGYPFFFFPTCPLWIFFSQIHAKNRS